MPNRCRADYDMREEARNTNVFRELEDKVWREWAESVLLRGSKEPEFLTPHPTTYGALKGK